MYQSQRGGGGIVGTMALISCSVPVSEGGGDSRYNGPYFVQCTSLRGGIVGTVQVALIFFGVYQSQRGDSR